MDDSSKHDPPSTGFRQGDSGGTRLGRWARRNLEGWQAGLVVVGAVLLAALLVAPRAITAPVVPLPVIDRRALAKTHETELARADFAVARGPLPFEARALGEALRRLGSAQVSGDAKRLAEAQADLARVVVTTRPRLDEANLLDLRAVQTRLFLDALRGRNSVGSAETTRDELGGALIAAIGRCEAAEACALDEGELGVLFRVRWAALLGLEQAPRLGPQLNEWRVYFSFMIRHPNARGEDAVVAQAQQLATVTALGQHDVDYPADLARGALLLRSHGFQGAAAALRVHLRHHPHGPWTLHAKNYLAHAESYAHALDQF